MAKRVKAPEPVIHPTLAPFVRERERLEGVREHIDRGIEDQNEAIRAAVAKLFNETHDDKVEPADLEVESYHVCAKGSPTGFCVYNTAEDPACDSCIYCHHPLERK